MRWAKGRGVGRGVGWGEVGWGEVGWEKEIYPTKCLFEVVITYKPIHSHPPTFFFDDAHYLHKDKGAAPDDLRQPSLQRDAFVFMIYNFHPRDDFVEGNESHPPTSTNDPPRCKCDDLSQVRWGKGGCPAT